MKIVTTESQTTNLRQKAEELLKMKPSKADSSLSAIETAKLIHELEVHQIELELQNEELVVARSSIQNIAEKYTELYDFAPSGYFTLDNTGAILECNFCGSKMLCKERSQLTNRSFALFVSPDTRAIFNLFIDKVFQSISQETCEVKLLVNSDIPTYVLLTGIITENQTQCNITMVDITRGKLLEERLLFISKAVESASDAIGISDAQGHHIYHNKALSDLFGFATAEELQAAGGGFKVVRDPGVAKEMFDNIMKGVPWAGELEMITKSGHIFPAYERADAITNSEGNIVGLIGVITDITDRKRSEESLREIQNKLSKANKLAHLGIWEWEANTDTVTWSEELYNIAGLDPKLPAPSYKEHVNQYTPESFKILNALVEKAMETGESYEAELELIRPDGDIRYVNAFGGAKHDAKGLIQGLFGALQDITELKQAEIELIMAKENAEESRNRFQRIFFGAPTGIGVVKDRIITEVNPKLLEITGYSEGDLIGQSTLILYPSKEEFDYVGKEKYRQFKETGSGTVETKWRKKDGTIIDVMLSSSPIFAGDYHKGLTFTVFDITARKLSEAIFKDIIEKNPLSIQILNLDGFTIQSNSAHTRLFGATPPADYSIFKDTQLLAQGLGELFEQIKNGEIVHFPDTYFNAHDVDHSFPDVLAWIMTTGFALNDSNGVPERIVLMHENITARKHAEAMFEDIVDKNPLSIQIVDKDGYTITGNPAYIKLFGAFPPPGFSIFANLEGKSPELEKLILRAKNGEVVNLPDICYNTKDVSPDLPDNPVWIRALIFPLNDSAGKPERYVLMHENITERKLAEQELIIAKEHAEESDRLKSAFLANMSHEIRTPMNGILGFADLLKEPELTGEEQQKYINIIEKSGARMLNIINDIIDISKIEAGLMEVDIKESNINEQIEYIYTFFKPEVEGKGMHLSFKNSLPAKEALIETDREKIYAILTNLVKNAIKYSDKGFIEFGYTLVETQRAASVETQRVASLRFFVKDTGLGIAKNRQDAIFERFIQANINDSHAYQGAGLGLSISKAYVEMLGGKIWVESEPGKGSTFYFTIPYNTKKQLQHIIANVVSQEDESGQIKNLKILIAEDDETSDLLITAMLKKNNYEVIHVNSGDQAVEACRNSSGFDLILMDIRMPGMDGYEATRQIRQFNKDVIIIAQTAYGLSGERENAIESGCNDYVAKPINREELQQLMQKYFSKNSF